MEGRRKYTRGSRRKRKRGRDEKTESEEGGKGRNYTMERQSWATKQKGKKRRK